jgi:hypothetical protein
LRHAYLAALALAGCTSVVTITPNVCGNDVLEPGEDCDQPTGCTSTCRIACAPAAATTCSGTFDGACCPDGMACGADRACHAPTGTLQTTELVQPFDVASIVVTDIDGDGIGDVMGVGADATSVLYGDLATPLARTVATSSPAPTNGVGAVFGDITGDGRDDAVIPTIGGVFALETSSGTPQPISFPVTKGTGLAHERVAAALRLGTLVDDYLEYDAVPGTVAGRYNFQMSVIIAPSLSSASWTTSPPQTNTCGETNMSLASGVRGRAIHPFVDGLQYRVPLVYNGSKAGVCVITADPLVTDSTYAIQKTVWTSYGYVAVEGDGETFFANLISPPGSCPDLVVPLSDGTNPWSMILTGTGASSACTVNTLAAPAFVRGLPYAAMTLAGRPALVTSLGIYTSFVAGANPASLPTREWRYAAVGDLNGDGRDDVVTVGTDTDVEVLFQRVGATPQFSVVTIPTDANVEKVSLGNFDGDLAGDVAIATIDPTVTNGAAELSIAWGSVDEAFSVTDVGAFAEATDFATALLVDTSLPGGDDQNSDVLVARGGAAMTAADPALLIAEYGSTSRVLTAPYVYLSSFGGGGNTIQPAKSVGVEVGDFATAGSPEVFSMFVPQQQQGSSTEPVSGAYVQLAEQSYGDFEASNDGAQTFCGADPTGDPYFCPSNGRYGTIERATTDVMLGVRADVESAITTPTDEMVQLTNAQYCMAYYPGPVGAANKPTLGTVACSALAPEAATSTDPDVMAAYAHLTGTNLRLLDGDGTTAHICLADSNTNAWEAFEWTLTVDADNAPHLASPIRFNTELAAALPAGSPPYTCEQALAVQLGTRTVNGTTYGAGAKEWVLPCSYPTNNTYDMQLWARYVDPGGGPPHYELLWDTKLATGITLRTGDVNGDGLDDIVFTNGTFGSGKEQLHVLVQCDAHETACTGGGS